MKKTKKSVKKRGKTLNRIKVIVLSIVIIALVAYVCYALYELIKQPTDTFVVEDGQLYLEESVTGYVIRDERLVQGKNYKNGIVQIKIDGEKTAKDEPIFRYYSNQESKLTEQIAELDTQIQEALQNDVNVFPGDITLLESQIQEKLERIYKVNQIQEIQKYKNEINSIITKKAKIAGDSSPSGSYIRKLIDKRKEYEKELNSSSEYINAPISGVVSYRIDGLEEVLSPNNFGSINAKLLEDLNIKTGQVIPMSEETAKIVNNYECYIAVIMNSEKAKEAEIGNKIKIQLVNSTEIPAEIVYIGTESNDSRVIILKIKSGVEDLITHRKISLDIIWWSATGLKVPNTALLTEDDKQYVVRNRAGYLDKILIKVLKQNQNYTIIDNYDTEELKTLGYSSNEIQQMKKIGLYDEIIQKPTLEMLQ